MAVLGYAAASGAVAAGLEASRTWPPEAGRRAYEELRAGYRDGDRLFVNFGAAYGYEFYKSTLLGDVPGLRSHVASRMTALADQRRANLCRGLKLWGTEARAGERVWFLSAHVPHVSRIYQDVLRSLGRVDVVLARERQSLVRVDLDKSFAELRCPRR